MYSATVLSKIIQIDLARNHSGFGLMEVIVLHVLENPETGEVERETGVLSISATLSDLATSH